MDCVTKAMNVDDPLADSNNMLAFLDTIVASINTERDQHTDAATSVHTISATSNDRHRTPNLMELFTGVVVYDRSALVQSTTVMVNMDTNAPCALPVVYAEDMYASRYYTHSDLSVTEARAAFAQSSSSAQHHMEEPPADILSLPPDSEAAIRYRASLDARRLVKRRCIDMPSSSSSSAHAPSSSSSTPVSNTIVRPNTVDRRGTGKIVSPKRLFVACKEELCRVSSQRLAREFSALRPMHFENYVSTTVRMSGSEIVQRMQDDYPKFRIRGKVCNRSLMQIALHTFLFPLFGCVIYQEEWFTMREAILKAMGWEDIGNIGAAICPRRFGKTEGIAQAAANTLLNIPWNDTVVLGPTLNQARNMMTVIVVRAQEHPRFQVGYRVVKNAAQWFYVVGPDGSMRTIISCPSRPAVLLLCYIQCICRIVVLLGILHRHQRTIAITIGSDMPTGAQCITSLLVVPVGMFIHVFAVVANTVFTR